jgi:hypothetical protein
MHPQKLSLLGNLCPAASKAPGFRLGGYRDMPSEDISIFLTRKFCRKTLQLFVSNSKRLGGYT